MKPRATYRGTSAHSLRMTRFAGICCLVFLPLFLSAQGGDQQVRSKADALFTEQRYAEALPLYTQLVSLSPQDRQLNFRLGACQLFGGEDKEKAIGYLKYAVEDPGIEPKAWYWLGRAYHLNYRFKEAEGAYQRYRGVADKRTLVEMPVEAFEVQCRNGAKLLSSLKEISVRSKVEVEDREFFRFYDLSDIGGRIVVTPTELQTALDKKNKHRGLVFLPGTGGPIYYSSYGKEGKTGLDIYRTELLTDGRFATPVKLAGYINTDLDDDYPFMHPDGKTFYFSSKGHSSMGGYDVFRATYDRGMDAFGRPENLDFAVSTPDDDIFYITDPEQKEACFASGRNSRQGKLHVYRVSTTQVPLVITVLKGTYASEFDANDRKARIVVEDALTRETVADVRTDINGNYVLALPRSGRFRFLVECGPSGKTHAGMVDVPRNDGPRAYRQELSLSRQGDQERLMIRNYFDEPLEGDIIAMALDEIKRRARLDIHEAVPAPVVEADAPVADVLTRAGFAGNVDAKGAVQLAKDDAAGLERLATAQEQQSQAAYRMAMDALEEAERNTREAADRVARANAMEDGTERNALMSEAARSRQVATEANKRATAAFRAGQELETASLTNRQKSVTATRLASDVERTLTAGKAGEVEAVQHLTTLKQQLDLRSGPKAEADLAELTRRAATERSKDADRAMQRAQTMRGEENELVDRINRLKHEQESARNKSRKDEIDRELTEYQQQLDALRSETNAAYARSRVMQEETAVIRGQAGLTLYLQENGAPSGTKAPTKSEVDALAQRIAGSQQRTRDLPVDERFDGLELGNVAEQEARTFDWSLAASGAMADTRNATRTADRNTTGDAQRAGGVNTTVAGGNVGDRTPEQARINTERAEREALEREALARADARSTNVQTTGPDGRPISANVQRDAAGNVVRGEESYATEAGSTADRAQAQGQNARTAGGEQARSNGSTTDAGQGTTSTRESNVQERGSDNGTAVRAAGTGNTAGTEERTATAAEQRSSQGSTEQGRSTNERADANARERSAGNDAASNAQLTPEQIRNAELANEAMDVTTDEADDLRAAAARQALDPFLLENELAELKQLSATERNRTRRDSLERRMRSVEQELADINAAKAVAEQGQVADGNDETDNVANEPFGMAAEDVDMSRSALVFDRSTTDEELVRRLYPDYANDKRTLERVSDADARAADLQGLELMLADSIKAEMVRQVVLLELAPEQADRVLPRVERLRKLREDHLAEAERLISERLLELANAGAEGDAPAAARNQQPVRRGSAAGKDPIMDRFVALDGDPAQVYASHVEHRSGKVADAVAFKEADLARMERIGQQVDSLVEAAAGLPRKDYDRVIKSADRLRDERLIISTDLGQRTAFLAREEWRVATDSLKRTEKAINSKGLPPTDPLLVMARTMKSDAERDFELAQQIRKRADRANDIMLRDSLYRSAYATELMALREMDRSITVYNYLLGEQHLRGETLAYNVVAARVLGIAEDSGTSGDTDPAIAARTVPATRIDERVVGSDADGTTNASTGTTGENRDTAQRTAQQDARPDTSNAERIADVEHEAATAGATVAAERNAGVDGPGATDPADAAATLATQETDRQRERADTEAATALAAENALAEQRRVAAERDRQQALEQARRAEETLSQAARTPAVNYEQFLQPAAPTTATSAVQPATNAAEARAEEARNESVQLQQQAAARDEAADELRAQAAGARKRDAQQLEKIALRESLAADSLRTAATLRLQQAGDLERQARRDAERAALEARLQKYYYLSGEDLGIALDNEDRSRYFSARSLALQQYDAADQARDAAASNRAVGTVLMDQARRAPEASAPVLRIRAEALMARADSLENVSDRLRGAAGINEAQAAVMLQAMPDDQASELMAMEMRARRSEALLSEARAQAGSQSREEPRNATTGAGSGTAASDVASSSAPTSVESRTTRPETAPLTSLPRQLDSDIFQLRPAGERRSTAIPMDVAMPEGIVFKVQIGAFRSAVPEEAFSDMTPVMGENVGNGLVRYTAGLFTGYEHAAQAKDLVRERGYRDAFVVAYRDGVRISLAEAMRESNAELASARTINPGSDVAPGTPQRSSTRQEQPATGGERTAQQQPSTEGRAPAEATTTSEPAAPTTATQPQGPVVSIVAPPTVAPSGVASATAEDPAVVLAAYPATAEAIMATFAPPADASSYYNVPGAAPARQVETIKGLFFTVQVGVYSKPVALDKLFNITPLNSERTEAGKIRYTTGFYLDVDEARVRKDATVVLGVQDAFVTAYLNGKRIPMREARALLEKFGPAILAQP